MDVSFDAILFKYSSSLWLVAHKRIHSVWYKRCRIVIVGPIGISVCGELGVHIGLSEEQ